MLPVETCQLKVLDRIYYVNAEDVNRKIKEGTVLRQDQIKVGNAAWTVIEFIPEFATVFDEFEAQNKLPENIDTTNIFTNFQVPEANLKMLAEAPHEHGKCCAVHSELPPFYVCTACENLFCKDCPAIEADAKICPFCGGKCILYLGQMWKFEKPPETKYDIKAEKIETAVEEIHADYVYTKLRKEDFFKALIYPLRFPVGLLTGGILSAVLVFGLIVTAFHGGWMFLLTIIITAMILMMKFGVLSRCFENLSQDTIKTGYMPRIKKFAIFEDFVHPFFMGLEVYLVAFGLFAVLALTLCSYAWFSFSDSADMLEVGMETTEGQINSTLNLDRKANGIRENEFRKIINHTRFSQMETIFGSNHLVDNQQLEKAVKSISRLTVYFQMPVVFVFILGVLFFPAVCLTIGRNHSLSTKQRFIFGFKEIKTIGFDYVKILFLCFVLLVGSAGAIYTLSLSFSRLELPIAGVLSAIIAGSFLIFYFWTVFSSILAITICDRAEQLCNSSEY